MMPPNNPMGGMPPQAGPMAPPQGGMPPQPPMQPPPQHMMPDGSMMPGPAMQNQRPAQPISRPPTAPPTMAPPPQGPTSQAGGGGNPLQMQQLQAAMLRGQPGVPQQGPGPVGAPPGMMPTG